MDPDPQHCTQYDISKMKPHLITSSVASDIRAFIKWCAVHACPGISRSFFVVDVCLFLKLPEQLYRFPFCWAKLCVFYLVKSLSVCVAELFFFLTFIIEYME